MVDQTDVICWVECRLVYDCVARISKMVLHPPHPTSTDTEGVFYRYIGHFELKFVSLSLIQSELNQPYNGGKTQKLWNGVEPLPR